MSSLNQYLELQRQKFERMQSRRQQLLQHQQLEQSRFEQLLEHLDALAVNGGGSALYLQNMGDIKNQMHRLCEQQQQRVMEASQEYHLQQRACLQQASFNLGLQHMLERRADEVKKQQQLQEQKQLDELVCNYHSRG
ncbi:hypothetical protein [Shewanella dokdonensis]|uniref:Flagellar FliJ protein n=1 Tax=Shewanella dokdonensis TaxID=712036 RepID=A0ABX8DDN4_9GAMM|nr:hypothetical protein [Shewanella dokdonensis]MCL1073447.1 hypothetical protein [Shewanella dokdonensis]QVK22756.1 hypothetical protein KHX94_16200 [Shewanella dokdonensis]